MGESGQGSADALRVLASHGQTQRIRDHAHTRVGEQPVYQLVLIEQLEQRNEDVAVISVRQAVLRTPLNGDPVAAAVQAGRLMDDLVGFDRKISVGVTIFQLVRRADEWYFHQIQGRRDGQRRSRALRQEQFVGCGNGFVG